MSELDLSGLNFGREKSGEKRKVFKPVPRKNVSDGKNGYTGNRTNNKNVGYNGNKSHGNRDFHSNGSVERYVGAPYNFVPFHTKVVPVENEMMPVRGVIENELYSGEISYSLKAETPVFVDNGIKEQQSSAENNKEKHDFYRNIYDKYAIPGSAVRGLFRSHSQVLGISGFDDDIDDYQLMFRKVGARVSDPDKKRYDELLGAGMVTIPQGNRMKQVSILKNVKAGYIQCENGKYYIYPTEVNRINPKMGEMNYYVLSERHISEHRSEKGFRYFSTEKGLVLQNDITKGFREEGNGRRKDYIGTQNTKTYKPYFREISYEVKDLKNISAVGRPGEYKKEGYLVSTGPMQKKKAIYIVPKKIDAGKFQIPEKDVKAFQIDYEKKKNTLKAIRGEDFFALPKAEEGIKPVFYIQLNGKLYFGFTPRLRLFYDHTIKEGYLQRGTNQFDLTKSIFGCTSEKESYKSKVSFSDAVCDEENPKKGDIVSLILGEPKPSSYMDYLEQTKEIVTYNDNFYLRGMKQYWLRPEVIDGGADAKDPSKEKVASKIYPVAKGTVFSGKVRFQNLTKAELGLLLWCIRLEKNSQINIGKAKAFGYGRCSVQNISVKVLNPEKAYLGDALDLNPFDTVDMDEYISFYKKDMSQKLQKNIEELASVRTFLLMKDVTRMPDEEKIRYMSIQKREYQNRTGALQKPDEVVKK